MVGLLKVAEAGLALGPKGRFQSEAEKELRPGACEEAAGANERSPTKNGRASESCGGRTRTCDLQVMSLASYQLLHSAMYYRALFLNAGAKVLLFCDMTKYSQRKM